MKNFVLIIFFKTIKFVDKFFRFLTKKSLLHLLKDFIDDELYSQKFVLQKPIFLLQIKYLNGV